MTMSVAVDGRLTVHPWLRTEIRQLGGDGAQLSVADQDVFSLIVARSKARGLASFSGDEPPSVRWGHNDAGGDWTQDGMVRRLAWFQCAVPGQPLVGRRLPIQPAFSVLDDLLSLTGAIDLRAVHAVVPVAAAPDGRFDLAAMARWFDFAHPETTRLVSVALSAPGSDPATFTPLLELVRTRSVDRIDPENAEIAALPPFEPPYGMPWLLGPGERVQLAMRCALPTWSIDAASWLVEILIEALRELQATGPVAISVITDLG
ncbi:MAG: hypothetical protein ACR2N4_06205 [Jatrophihabitans sp.]